MTRLDKQTEAEMKILMSMICVFMMFGCVAEQPTGEVGQHMEWSAATAEVTAGEAMTGFCRDAAPWADSSLTDRAVTNLVEMTSPQIEADPSAMARCGWESGNAVCCVRYTVWGPWGPEEHGCCVTCDANDCIYNCY
jgi:hypothetical protein